MFISSPLNVSFLKDLIPPVSYRAHPAGHPGSATVTVTPYFQVITIILYTNIVFNPLTLFASLILRYVSGSEVDSNASTPTVRRHSSYLILNIFLWSVVLIMKTNPIDNWNTRPLKSIVNSISLANSCCYSLQSVGGELARAQETEAVLLLTALTAHGSIKIF